LIVEFVRQVHDILHLHLSLHDHRIHPLQQTLFVARDAIINLPVVEVKRRRDGGG
jgi:hypothetical protein